MGVSETVMRAGGELYFIAEMASGLLVRPQTGGICENRFGGCVNCMYTNGAAVLQREIPRRSKPVPNTSLRMNIPRLMSRTTSTPTVVPGTRPP